MDQESKKRLFGSFPGHILTKKVRPFPRLYPSKMTSVFLDRVGPSMMPLSFSRGQMVREASLTEADLAEIAKCRRDQNRLGFAYQVGFVQLFSRFPAQQPLEVCDELLNFVAMQLNIEATQIDGYAARQHTVSDHQASIRGYLKLAVFGADQAQALERFVFEESSRLEQTAALLARAREFLKERRVLFPADSALLRLVGEQRRQARERIVSKLAGGLSPGVVEAIDGLLEVKDSPLRRGTSFNGVFSLRIWRMNRWIVLAGLSSRSFQVYFSSRQTALIASLSRRVATSCRIRCRTLTSR